MQPPSIDIMQNAQKQNVMPGLCSRDVQTMAEFEEYYT
jgi:hypothetical protein